RQSTPQRARKTRQRLLHLRIALGRLLRRHALLSLRRSVLLTLSPNAAVGLCGSCSRSWRIASFISSNAARSRSANEPLGSAPRNARAKDLRASSTSRSASVAFFVTIGRTSFAGHLLVAPLTRR